MGMCTCLLVCFVMKVRVRIHWTLRQSRNWEHRIGLQVLKMFWAGERSERYERRARSARCEFKEAGGMGGAVRPQSGFGAKPRKILKILALQDTFGLHLGLLREPGKTNYLLV